MPRLRGWKGGWIAIRFPGITLTIRIRLRGRAWLMICRTRVRKGFLAARRKGRMAAPWIALLLGAAVIPPCLGQGAADRQRRPFDWRIGLLLDNPGYADDGRNERGLSFRPGASWARLGHFPRSAPSARRSSTFGITGYPPGSRRSRW